MTKTCRERTQGTQRGDVASLRSLRGFAAIIFGRIADAPRWGHGALPFFIATVLRLATLASFAAEPVYLWVMPPTTAPPPGQVIQQVMMKAPAGTVHSLDLRLSYTPTTAVVSQVQAGSLAAVMSMALNTNTAGVILASLAAANPIGGEGPILNVVFAASGSPQLTIGQASVDEGLVPCQISPELYVTATTPIRGRGTAPFAFTFFSLQVMRPMLAAGTVTALGTSTFTDDNASWTTDQFNGANGPSFVEFATGDRADIVATDGANRTLVLSRNLVGAVPVGTPYRIRPHFTMAAIFGAANQVGLLAGANSSLADNVLLYDPVTQQTTVIYYSSTANCWRRGPYNMNNQAALPGQGLIIQRRGDGDLTLSLTGAAKAGPTKVAVLPGFNLLGTLKRQQSLALSDMNLYTGDAGTGMAGGANSSVTDNLLVVRPDGTIDVYYYSTTALCWRKGPYNSNAILIAPGSAFYIRRRAATSFDWNIPQEMPY